MTDDNGYKAGQVRDEISQGNIDAVLDAYETDIDEASDLLQVMDRAGVDEDNPFRTALARQTRTETLRQARQEGHLSTMSSATGIQRGKGVEMADWRRYEQLKDLYRKEPKVNSEFTNKIFQCIIFSSQIPPTGRGKSNSMYTLTEFGDVVYGGDLRVMSNNTSDPYETVSEQWSDIEESIREYDGWQILLIDEAAQFLQYADQGAGKTVSQMLKLLRHNYCHLIMVAHTGMDIPADIRRQVFVLDKHSEKQATLGYGITPQKDNDRMQVAEKVLQLESIPATEVPYDDIDDEGIEIKFDDEDNEEDAAPLCQATTRMGDSCPNNAKYPLEEPQYCQNHRNRLSDASDVSGAGDEQDSRDD